MQFKVELHQVELVFLPKKNAPFFEQKHLLGEAVANRIPSAKSDIKDAGNCLAADLYTAAVFHLMRVINIGLRETAWSLGIKKIGGKKLEYCRDDSIIEEIEEAVDNKMEAVDTLKRGEKWERQKAFYHGLLQDLRYFKDVVRDPMAHARKSYTEHGALDIYNHVRGFMQRLAHNISTVEQRKTKRFLREMNQLMRTIDKGKK